MMPEFLSSLSDKQGPLVDYLRYHSWDQYGWSPDGLPPQKPADYDDMEWRYLQPVADPKSVFQGMLLASKDKRAIELRQLMSIN